MSASAKAALIFSNLLLCKISIKKVKLNPRSRTIRIPPLIISQPVAARKPPITGKGIKRIAFAARKTPNSQRIKPVRPVDSAMTIITGASKSSGSPISFNLTISAETKLAVTAAVAPSKPAMTKGMELRKAITPEPIAIAKNVAANP